MARRHLQLERRLNFGRHRVDARLAQQHRLVVIVDCREADRGRCLVFVSIVGYIGAKIIRGRYYPCAMCFKRPCSVVIDGLYDSIVNLMIVGVTCDCDLFDIIVVRTLEVADGHSVGSCEIHINLVCTVVTFLQKIPAEHIIGALVAEQGSRAVKVCPLPDAHIRAVVLPIVYPARVNIDKLVLAVAVEVCRLRPYLCD
ncbi:hypothetical protein SDC9_155250 [bioreactor metagenome]|uniref:Uncharacterized protein n=1 Tax=bioreactor metagenome TaxID=1076179 RepID=A0A645F5U1_9ZZZZ